MIEFDIEGSIPSIVLEGEVLKVHGTGDDFTYVTAGDPRALKQDRLRFFLNKPDLIIRSIDEYPQLKPVFAAAIGQVRELLREMDLIGFGESSDQGIQ